MPPKNKSCCDCDNTAKVHVSFVSGANTQTKSYCHKHAAELGLLDSPAWNLAGSMQPSLAANRPGIACDVCGTSQHEFEKTGRLGCPHCYETFKSIVIPVLGKVQLGGQHVGKIPHKTRHTKAVHNRIKYLQDQIQEAVVSERYEDAATLRDQINDLQGASHAVAESN